MDGLEFDAWTRRRLGLVMRGLAVSAGALALFGGAEARPRTSRRKRCRKLGDSCSPAGRDGQCCGGLNCDPIHDQTGLRCCYGRQHPCNDSDQCCGNTSCDPLRAPGAQICCGRGGVYCRGDQDCCTEFSCSGGQCLPTTSDRDRKTNLGSVDPEDMLQRVRDLPISTWNYTADDPSVRHIGPMAQDFAALFGVGADDRHIHPLDGQGVALAAIQGLLHQIEELRQENSRLAARIDALENSVE